MKEIDNENATRANATRHNLYIIHKTQIHTNKYIEHNPSKLTTTSMREKGQASMRIHKQQVVAIVFSRRRERECSASRTFVRLIVLNYKRARQSRLKTVVRIQSALCEVACKENSNSLKVVVVKINRTIVSVYACRSVRRRANSCVIGITNCLLLYKLETVARKIVRTIGSVI